METAMGDPILDSSMPMDMETVVLAESPLPTTNAELIEPYNATSKTILELQSILDNCSGNILADDNANTYKTAALAACRKTLDAYEQPHLLTLRNIVLADISRRQQEKWIEMTAAEDESMEGVVDEQQAELHAWIKRCDENAEKELELRKKEDGRIAQARELREEAESKERDRRAKEIMALVELVVEDLQDIKVEAEELHNEEKLDHVQSSKSRVVFHQDVEQAHGAKGFPSSQVHKPVRSAPPAQLTVAARTATFIPDVENAFPLDGSELNELIIVTGADTYDPALLPGETPSASQECRHSYYTAAPASQQSLQHHASSQNTQLSIGENPSSAMVPFRRPPPTGPRHPSTPRKPHNSYNHTSFPHAARHDRGSRHSTPISTPKKPSSAMVPLKLPPAPVMRNPARPQTMELLTQSGTVTLGSIDSIMNSINSGALKPGSDTAITRQLQSAAINQPRAGFEIQHLANTDQQYFHSGRGSGRCNEHDTNHRTTERRRAEYRSRGGYRGNKNSTYRRHSGHGRNQNHGRGDDYSHTGSRDDDQLNRDGDGGNVGNDRFERAYQKRENQSRGAGYRNWNGR